MKVKCVVVFTLFCCYAACSLWLVLPLKNIKRRSTGRQKRRWLHRAAERVASGVLLFSVDWKEV